MSWWKALNIDALPVARQLWEQTHPNEEQAETQKAVRAPMKQRQKLMATEKQIAANR